MGNRLTENFLKWIKTLMLTGVGIALFYFAVRNQNWGNFRSIISGGTYYNVFGIVLVSYASYWFRTKRWKLLLHAAGKEASFVHSISALSVSYMINYAIPRLGELTRCYIIRRREGIPFELSLGTVIMERLVDIAILGLVVSAALLLQFKQLFGFAKTNIYQPIREKIGSAEIPLHSILLMLAVVVLLYFIVQKISKWKSGQLQLHSFVDGLKSIRQVKSKRQFAFYTAGIWTCYFLMTYLWAFSFTETENISPLQAFVVMVAGTLGRSLPIQGGGFGAYHFMVTQTLVIYGITEQAGFALAVLIHGGQMVFSLLIGLAGYFYLMLTEKKQ